MAALRELNEAIREPLVVDLGFASKKWKASCWKLDGGEPQSPSNGLEVPEFAPCPGTSNRANCVLENQLCGGSLLIQMAS